MDLERIKQNFRLRSGRARPQRKRPNAATASTTASPGQQAPKGTTSGPFDEQRKDDSQSAADLPQGEPTIDGAGHSSGSQEDEVLEEKPVEQNDADVETVKMMAEAGHTDQLSTSEAEDFDLNPPKPRPKPPSLETLAELLFSAGHLNCLLHHPQQLSRFSAFLQRYIPHYHPLLSQYLETQKAIKAIEYANALAEGLKPKETGQNTSLVTRHIAAKLDPEFEDISNASFKALVGDALPAYISYSLIKTVSECLTNEIVGRYNSPMREFVGGLSEVFCLTDPNQPDNPIIYASEEFYRLTRYGPEDVINNNCRFLQGRKTNPDSHKRLKAAIQKGEEICETLLNYRRDGKPFMNLLMIAPLHDRHGKIKYHIGAQIDVTGLVQGGRALSGFQRYLDRRAASEKRNGKQLAEFDMDDEQKRKSRALSKLRDLSEMFDLEESAIVQASSRSSSLTRDEDDNRSVTSVERTPRRILGDSDASDFEENEEGENHTSWELGNVGGGRLSGRLPGVYDSFMLLRPAPSMRIVFVSPKLQKIGNVLQTPFMSHIAAPTATLTGLGESLRAGVPVSAKVHFMPERGGNRDGTTLKNGTKHEDGPNGKAIWVSLSPLLGDDDRIGVWMCVVVEKSKIGPEKSPRSHDQTDETMKPLKRQRSGRSQQSRGRPHISVRSRNHTQSRAEGQEPDNTLPAEDTPIRPIRVDSRTRMKQTSFQKSNEDDLNHLRKTTKTLRAVESIYFDAEGGQENTTHETMHGSDTLQTTGNPTRQRDNKGSGSISQAVESPVDEYEEVKKSAKAYSVQVPGLFQSTWEEPDDDYITTRSPQMEAQDTNDRLIIEDDSDTFAEWSQTQDDAVSHAQESTGRISASRSPLPGSLLASDLPPSIPSSAESAKEENKIDAVDSTSPVRASHSSSSHNTQDQERETARLEHNYECDDGSPDTLRDISQDRKQHHDDDADSAISMDSPTHFRRQTSDAGSGHSAPLSPALQAQEHESEAAIHGHGYDHEKAGEKWVGKSRPAPSQQASQVGMDYLRAGRGGWPRPPNLSHDSMLQAQAMYGEDGLTDPDECVRSPYSVD